MHRFAIILLVMLAGCGQPTGRLPAADPAGLLVRVRSAAELEAAIVAAAEAKGSPGWPVFDAVTGGTGRATYTTTYTREADVDEFDVVKYDGEFMYVAPTRSAGGCCLAAPWADAWLPPTPGDHRIRIYRTEPEAALATEVSAIELGNDERVQGLYLDGGRLAAISTGLVPARYGLQWTHGAYWYDQTTRVTLWDTTNPAAPELAREIELDGGFVDSARVGDNLYVVTRFTPPVTDPVTDPANARLADLLPRLRVNGSGQPGRETPMFRAQDCYAAREGGAVAVLTSITVIAMEGSARPATRCYAGDAYGLYLTASALYLSEARHIAQQTSPSTRIHKFRLDRRLRYAGSAEVDGMVWAGGQADFRMSEHDGHLRVVTTRFEYDAADSVDHHLYVLAEGQGPMLERVGELPNTAQPEEIGKPHENLYGVRFTGERAYLVTFLQTDPLYVLDLADPRAPRVAGTLEVTGFSDFLHPVNESLLLGIGQSAERALKLELFDVSRLDDPRSQGAIVVGGPGTHSEAQHDRHAFAYLAGDEVDRFVLPVEVFAASGANWQESGALFFEVRDKQTPNLASLARTGSLIVERATQFVQWPVFARNRAVVHGDAVYFVRDTEVRAGFWGVDTDISAD